MNTKEFIKEVCQEIDYKPIRNSIAEEIDSHIQELQEENIKKGLSKEESERIALEQMGEAKSIGKALNKIHRPKLDWKLVLLVFFIFSFGILITICKQTTKNTGITEIIVNILFGFLIGFGIYFFDYRKIRKYSNLVYLVALLALLLPAFDILTNTIGGIKHISIMGINFKPTVISVPLFIIAFVGFLIDYNTNNKLKISLNITNSEHNISLTKDLLKIIVLSLFSIIMIAETPSLTNAVILSIIYIVLATIYIVNANEKWKTNILKFYGIIGTVLICFMLLIGERGILYFINRFDVSINPEKDPNGMGYIGMLEKEIIDNANFIGEANTEIMDKEVIHTESAFSFVYLIGKLGIIAGVTLIISILLMFYKLIFNVKLIKDVYGKFIIIGLSLFFIIQASANILMNLNLGIKVDVLIPFINFSGLYFIMNCICLALILSVYRRKDIIMNS